MLKILLTKVYNVMLENKSDEEIDKIWGKYWYLSNATI